MKATGLLLAKLPVMPEDWHPTAIPSKRQCAASTFQSSRVLLTNVPSGYNASRSVALSGRSRRSVAVLFHSRRCMRLPPLTRARARARSSISHRQLDGGYCAVIAASDNDQDELDKGIKAVLIAASPLASLEQFQGLLHSSLLSQAVEQPRVSIREFRDA